MSEVIKAEISNLQAQKAHMIAFKEESLSRQWDSAELKASEKAYHEAQIAKVDAQIAELSK
ncbi:hypothetical protein [Phyllobacterium sophorae]|uniref:Uncharacterized protein n=1 Tax=Phyllobacterium sophorae TaxID=1520277 RepID=A0A2P7BDW6_9HYPH|nr:hypothetical protein [Phyllobacterium sophorae]PSH64651.1 hypothetical protein CU103_12265 [Phyllobacterium sophorae]